MVIGGTVEVAGDVVKGGMVEAMCVWKVKGSPASMEVVTMEMKKVKVEGREGHGFV